MTSIKLTLEHSIDLADGTRVRAVLVRPPTVDEIEEISARARDMFEVRLATYARCTDLPERIIEELDFADIQRLDRLLDDLTNALAT